MMNFMSGNPGFYEEMGAAGRAMSSSSSSPSSSLHHRGGAGPTNNDDSDDLMLLRQQGSVGGGGGGSSNATTTVLEREHMFDKVVTPSDVGKLNRLVIPKQHAEKYFPLDSSNNEKGLLLNFEDRNGKPWRFRYSYWNSSQSYVMTKGWSRFVKEKKLDAGDIVSFQRGVGEMGKDQLFIDWRRRPDAPDHMHHYPSSLIPHHHFSSFQRSYNNGMNQPWNPLYLQQPSSLMLHNHHQSQQYHHHHPYGGGGGGPSYSYNTVVNGNPCPPGSIVYLRSGPQGGVLSGGPQQMGVVHHMSSTTTSHGPVEEQMVFDSVPVVQGKAAAKRLRLFGVNMDCPISESDECDILSTTSTTTIPFHHLPHPNSPNYSSSSSQFIMQPNSNNYSEEEKGKGTTTSMSLDLDI